MTSERVVVDASVAVKWLVEEVDSEEAIKLGQGWAEAGVALAAPHLLPFEVANALHRRVLSEELSIDRVGVLVDFLLDMGIELFGVSALHLRALTLASELNQQAAYDSHYLVLAEELDCEFWTADARFYRAASPTVDRIRLLGGVTS
ncbi:MAG: type II toxin-antitoxin system VapC family toxin [Chloroflexota bacterium]|nr:type II toxin-antitoxin system VapC family toxin [Chloroflexota bacterium]MDE2695052.1 type II toxin-antitoxin system VapC family toxin [Chloroflexota bacterium]MXW23814.1 type II toxin-antitoxin system VapC family toxin [Chloroflexota bacterium]